MVILVVILVVVCLALVFRMKVQHAQMEKLRKSDKVKTAFIRGLSREIRTHVHSVSGLAGIISQEDLYLSKSEKKSISTRIQYNTGLISTLLDEVAIFSEEEGDGGHQMQDERFSPNLICRQCLEVYRPSVGKELRLTFRSELGEGFYVFAERHIVELILNKLVASACQYTQKGEVTLGCSMGAASNLLSFYVQDTGCGIPEERKDHLFCWFDSLDDSATDTEVDLSVGQRLATKLGGYLRWDETYQKGTRMVLTIPVRKDL